MFHEGVDQLGLQVVLIATLAGPLHSPAMGLGADFPGPGHHFHFGRALVQTHVVQQVFKGHQLTRRMGSGPHFTPDDLHPVHHPVIEDRVFAKRVIHPAAAFNHAGQDVVDIADREGIVQAIALDGSLGPHQETVPEFFLRIALLAKQHGLAVFPARNQYQYRFRLAKPGQVLKVAVLAERMQNIPVTHTLRRCRQNGDAVRSHPVHQLSAAVGKFFHRNH